MMTSKQTKLTVTAIAVTILNAAIIGLLVKWHDDLALLSALFGTVIGWVLGTFLSPYGSEVRHFESFGKIVGAFVTGFLASKLDTVFGLIPRNEYHDLVRDPMVVRRVMLSLTCCLISMMAVFVARRYYRVDPPTTSSST